MEDILKIRLRICCGWVLQRKTVTQHPYHPYTRRFLHLRIKKPLQAVYN
jgi:hypothetical protein